MTVGDNPVLSFEILDTFREANKQIRDRKDITIDSVNINSKLGKNLKDKKENSKELADDNLETEIFDDSGKLKPNIRYKTGEYNYLYETDSEGRISKIETDNLQLTNRKERLPHNPHTPGKLKGDHAGHLIGDRFGGSPEIDNLVSQSANVNLSQYKKIENKWAKAINAGNHVTINVEVKYNEDSLRLSEFIVEYTINNKYFQEDIINKPKKQRKIRKILEVNMSKVFEDLFSELQADMVSICLENVERRANVIYIYCSYEDNVVASCYFYNINGMVVSRSELNDAIRPDEMQYDVSVGRQKAVTKIINEDIKQIEKVCSEYNRPMPTEMKLIYDVKKNSLKTEYKYENVYSESETKTAYDIADEWFEEIKETEI